MALNTFFSGLCPPDCDTELTYPAIEADQNCTSFSTYLSQISDLYLMPVADPANTPPFTWASTETITPDASQIDNTDETNTKTKWLTGEGGVDAPEKTVIEVFKSKDIVSKRTYTLTFNVKNMSFKMYNFLVALQCGATNFRFWFANEGGLLFGKDGGIEPKSIDVEFIHSNSRGDILNANIIIQWESKLDPERKINPLAS